HPNFQLDGDGEYLALVKPDGTTVAHEFTPEFPPQRSDVSYGMTADLTTFFVPESAEVTYLVPTPAEAGLGTDWTEPAFDDNGWTGFAQASRVLVTEAGGGDRYFVEIQNVAETAVDTSGWVVAINDPLLLGDPNVINTRFDTLWDLPDSMASGEVLFTTNDPEDLDHYLGEPFFWRTQGPGWVLILDGSGDVVDFVVWGYGAASLAKFDVTINSHRITAADVGWNGPSVVTAATGDNSLQRGGGSDHDGAGDWAFVEPQSKGNTNLGLLAPFTTDVATGIGFDATGTGVGAAVQIDVEAEMYGQNGSLWARYPFEIDNPLELDAMQLRMKYNDGFVAYLNGVSVAASNAPASPGWNAVATVDRDAAGSLEFETFDLTPHLELLQPGVNVLAIHGLNFSAVDPDFLILPDLGRSSRRFFGNPTPGTANTSGFVDFVADTKFSIDRGFFDAPLDVAITSATPGSSIHYTLDGSEPTETHGIEYTDPIHITTTTTLRTMALKADMEPSNVDTQTYIFLGDVISQTNTPPGYPSTWTGAPADYEMDPEVVGPANLFGDLYRDTIVDDLKSLPTLSIVMDQGDLFDSASGIYVNSQKTGDAWERPTSVELIFPDALNASEESFQFNCGIRIQGGSSRSPDIPKHSFRLEFRNEYGMGRLDYPLFEDQPFGEFSTREFDEIVLRTSFNQSWSHRHYYQTPRAQYVRDQWARDLQFAMGHLSTQGRYMHLYLNGMYWGIYNVGERPAAPFQATYLGGNEVEYDVLNSGAVIDGNNTAWNAMFALANAGLASAEAYAEIQQYLDVDNLIDYMILNHYFGNADWDGHNWIAARRREDGAQFKFYAWDSEFAIALPPSNTAIGQSAEDQIISINRTNLNNNNKPSRLLQKLRQNEEFLLRFADRVHRHMLNDGVLTPDESAKLWNARAAQVDRAVVAESARWGDYRRDVYPNQWPAENFDLYTRDEHYLAQQEFIRQRYLPVRTGIVLDQYRSGGWYPSLAAPSFNQHGGWVHDGFKLTMEPTAGTIYYSLDGTDPRVVGGAVAQEALVYSPGMQIPLTEGTVVKARARSGATWSALNEAAFSIGQPATAENFVVTEINYNPAPPTTGELAVDDTWTNTAFEFIELQNVGPETINLAGAQFTAGIHYTFDDIVELDPGQYIVVAANPQALATRYDTAGILIADGNYTGALDSNGERIRLGDDLGGEILDFTYNDTGSWPGRADGKGATLELIDPDAVPHDDPARSE
ncbi:MAG: CotH kinase family protein, partial [Candidatus Nealsonbacteria bacterium]|nr:CotH kinase family protein [Candidatus Nealsonbacteria bacterium]